MGATPRLPLHPSGRLADHGLRAGDRKLGRHLGNSPPVKLRCEPISRIEDTDTMVSTVYERFAAPGTEGAFTPVLATNVYRRIEGAWKIIVHHASPIVSRVQVASDGETMTRH